MKATVFFSSPSLFFASPVHFFYSFRALVLTVEMLAARVPVLLLCPRIPGMAPALTEALILAPVYRPIFTLKLEDWLDRLDSFPLL